MTSNKITRRSLLKTTGTGIFVTTTAGIFTSKNAVAIEPMITLGLINALISLYSVISQKEQVVSAANINRDAAIATANINRDVMLAQIKSSIEVTQNQKFRDFHMQNSDPNKLLKEYSNDTVSPLNCQEKISKNEFLTIQNGVPYLHKDGYGNQAQSNINRWEADEFNRLSMDGYNRVVPVPTSERSIASNNERRILDKRGVDSDIWQPDYSRSIQVGSANRTIIVASNGSIKKAILV